MNNIKNRIDKATKALNILSQAENELNLAKAFEVKKKMLLKEANNPKKIIELKNAIKKAEYETELKKKALIKIAIKALKIHGGAQEYLFKEEDFIKKEQIEKDAHKDDDKDADIEKKNLEDFRNKIKQQMGKDAYKEIKNLEDKINAEIKKLADEINAEINKDAYKEIKNLEDEINAEIKNLEDEINAEINKDAYKEIKKLEDEIKINNENYFNEYSKDIYINLYKINKINKINEIDDLKKKLGGFYKKNTKKIKGGFDIRNITQLLKDTKKLLKHKIETDDNFNIVADIVFANNNVYKQSVEYNKSRLYFELNNIIKRIDSEIEKIQDYLSLKVNFLKELIDQLNKERKKLIEDIHYNKNYISQCEIDRIILQQISNSTYSTSKDKEYAEWIFANSKSAKESSDLELKKSNKSIEIKEKDLIKLKLDVAKMNRIIIELNSAKDKLVQQIPIYES